MASINPDEIKILTCWRPADVIAVIIVTAATFLLYMGKDGVIASALLAVVAFYFGALHPLSPIQKALSRA